MRCFGNQLKVSSAYTMVDGGRVWIHQIHATELWGCQAKAASNRQRPYGATLSKLRSSDQLINLDFRYSVFWAVQGQLGPILEYFFCSRQFKSVPDVESAGRVVCRTTTTTTSTTATTTTNTTMIMMMMWMMVTLMMMMTMSKMAMMTQGIRHAAATFKDKQRLQILSVFEEGRTGGSFNWIWSEGSWRTPACGQRACRPLAHLGPLFRKSPRDRITKGLRAPPGVCFVNIRGMTAINDCCTAAAAQVSKANYLPMLSPSGHREWRFSFGPCSI